MSSSHGLLLALSAIVITCARPSQRSDSEDAAPATSSSPSASGAALAQAKWEAAHAPLELGPASADKPRTERVAAVWALLERDDTRRLPLFGTDGEWDPGLRNRITSGDAGVVLSDEPDLSGSATILSFEPAGELKQKERFRERVEVCYQNTLLEYPQAEGSVELEGKGNYVLRVERNGAVPPDLLQCCKSAGTEFPADQGETKIRVRFARRK